MRRSIFAAYAPRLSLRFRHKKIPVKRRSTVGCGLSALRGPAWPLIAYTVTIIQVIFRISKTFRRRAAIFAKAGAKTRRLSAFRNWDSISNFDVSLPNLSEKDVKGLLSRQRAVITTRNWKSNSNFCVSLPNLSKKDVKGLLSRKQPLHTSPNRSKKGEEGAALLSSLGNLSSPPRRLEQV